jgi:hypothetical protein
MCNLKRLTPCDGCKATLENHATNSSVHKTTTTTAAAAAVAAAATTTTLLFVCQLHAGYLHYLPKTNSVHRVHSTAAIL